MLTKREAAIITIYTGVLIGEFSEAHKYAEELAGRPVFTHEFASKELNEFLCEKAKKDFISIPVGDDLAEENARLKAKLDAVRKWASNPVRIDDFGYQMAQESVLAIIEKDGDEDDKL